MTRELVPNRQVTTTRVIISPMPEVYEHLDIDTLRVIDILTLGPFEIIIIVTGIAAKASNVQIGFLNRFTGLMVVTGDMEDVDTTLRAVDNTLSRLLGFSIVEATEM